MRAQLTTLLNPHLQSGINEMNRKQDRTNDILVEQSGYLKALVGIMERK